MQSRTDSLDGFHKITARIDLILSSSIYHILRCIIRDVVKLDVVCILIDQESCWLLVISSLAVLTSVKYIKSF